MLKAVLLVLVCATACCWAAATPGAGMELDVVRALQWDVPKASSKRETTPFGPRKAGFRGNVGGHKGLTLLKVDEIPDTEDAVKSLIAEKTAGGGAVLVLGVEQGASRTQLLERALVSDSFEGPVYFARSTDASTTEDLAKQRDSGAFMAVQSEPSADEAAAISAADLSAKVFSLEVGNLAASGKQNPLLVIAATYDTLGVAPSLVQGHAGSAATLLLSLARSFVAARGEGKQDAHKFNVLFMLSGGGRQSYYGTRKWIQSESSIASRVRFVLSLEDILDAQPDSTLFLHKSKGIDHAMFAAIQSAAAETGVTIKTKASVFDHARTELRWEHELYADKGVPGATLTSSAVALPHVLRSPLSRVTKGNPEWEAKIFSLVATAISAVSGQPKPTTVKAPTAVLMNKHLSSSRSPMDVSDDLLDAYQEALRSQSVNKDEKTGFVSKFRVKRFAFDATVPTYYDGAKLKLRFYESISATSELGITAAILSALFLLSLHQVGWNVAKAVEFWVAQFSGSGTK